MREVNNRILGLLEEEEKIIFVTKIEGYLSLAISDKEELENTEVYISNFANMYFYNTSKDFIYIYKQKETVKKINYKINNGRVICKINKLLLNPEKNNFFSISYLNGSFEMSEGEFKRIKERISISFFEEELKVEPEEVLGDEILSGNNLYKIYGNNKEEIAALNGVTVKVKEKDFICIMGPSGSGKSTLINSLSTIDSPTKGTIKFKGKNLLQMSEKEISRFRYENLGFIFQDFNLVDSLTIKENIVIPLILASLPRKKIEERVNNIASTLDIEKILNKYPGQCSGGQNQRAACARALIANPKIIIADEPTGNLDTKNSHELLKMMQKLNDEEGITIIMVTHDNMIASYSKKLMFIRDGKVDEVIERGNRSQKEYFYNIVDITSKESQNLIDIL